MGQTPEDLEKEIEQTRDALGEKVDVLAGQIREGVDGAKSKGTKVLGIVFAAVVGILTLKRLRRK